MEHWQKSETRKYSSRKGTLSSQLPLWVTGANPSKEPQRSPVDIPELLHYRSKEAGILISQFSSVHSWRLLGSTEVINFPELVMWKNEKKAGKAGFPVRKQNKINNKKNLWEINVEVGRYTKVNKGGNMEGIYAGN